MCPVSVINPSFLSLTFFYYPLLDHFTCRELKFVHMEKVEPSGMWYLWCPAPPQELTLRKWTCQKHLKHSIAACSVSSQMSIFPSNIHLLHWSIDPILWRSPQTPFPSSILVTSPSNIILIHSHHMYKLTHDTMFHSFKNPIFTPIPNLLRDEVSTIRK